MTSLKKHPLAFLLALSIAPTASFAGSPPASVQDAKQVDTAPQLAQARPNPDASGKYHIGDGVTAPKLIHSVEPKFSKEARRAKMSGHTLVRLTVNTDGTPSDVHIIKSFADTVDEKMRAAALSLDENAVKAVEQYRFQPATYEGKAVPLELNIEVNYQIF